jgi:group I intron endonuclease
MFIYKITNLLNNKIYIGKTEKTIEKRFFAHVNNAKLNKQSYLYNAMRHVGCNNFKVENIEKCLSVSELNRREKELITEYHSDNREFGYNIAKGGLGGDTFSSQTEIRKNEICQKRSKSMAGKNKGKKLTLENKIRISKTLTGRKDSPGTRLKKSNSSKISQNRPDVIEKKRKSMLGKKHSIETKIKIRKSNLGQKRTIDIKNKISKAKIGIPWSVARRLACKK